MVYSAGEVARRGTRQRVRAARLGIRRFCTVNVTRAARFNL
jgi:hypothetical protein